MVCREPNCTEPVRVKMAGFTDGRGYCDAHKAKAYAWNRGLA